jgi:hypothetical protein
MHTPSQGVSALRQAHGAGKRIIHADPGGGGKPAWAGCLLKPVCPCLPHTLKTEIIRSGGETTKRRFPAAGLSSEFCFDFPVQQGEELLQRCLKTG